MTEPKKTLRRGTLFSTGKLSSLLSLSMCQDLFWWKHFQEVIVNGKKMARCKYCRVLYEKNGTGNMKSHMLKKHSDQMSGGHDLVQSTITSDVTKAVFKASFLLFSGGYLIYSIFIAILQFNRWQETTFLCQLPVLEVSGLSVPEETCLG